MDLNLGVIGNCAIAALIDRSARMVWCCLPRFDGDPAFCSLVGGAKLEGQGEWSIALEGAATFAQRYRPNTATLETDIADAAGNAIRVIDVAPRYRHFGRMFRPAMLVRRIEPLAGTPRVIVRFTPRRDHGENAAELTRGSNHIRCRLSGETMRLTTDVPVGLMLSGTPFLLDRPMTMLLGPDEPLEGPPRQVGLRLIEQTDEHWRDWVRSLSIPFEWQDVVIRAAITLKLCNYEETGAIVAALTTSIPEYGAGARNWDYRYCWIRDSFFTVQALNSLGATKTMEDFIVYMQNVIAGTKDGYLQPLYGLAYETSIAEWEAPGLGGYRNLGPVRIGNAAFNQVQNDAYGSVILAVSQAFFDRRMVAPGSVELFRRMEALGVQAERLWDQPDASVWEFRNRAAVHTHSSVMCWAACDRLARIATELGLKLEAARWLESAARIHKGIVEAAFSTERGCFVSAFGGDALDASLLLLADVGFVAYDDPRFLSTVAVIEKELAQGRHVLRYAIPDDFGPPESAFTICTLWYAEALARIGRRDEARDIFEDVLSTRNHLGLLSEGLHLDTRELWGNFPQTYSMVGLIRVARRLSRPWDEAF